MKYNIFITGASGTGKTRLARWLARGFRQEWAGYETIKIEKSETGPIYSLHAVPGGERAPAMESRDGRLCPVQQSYETLGTAALKAAREGDAPIVMMDEICGCSAENAGFISEVYKTLSSPKTVIAVVKKEPLGDLERLKTVHNAMWIDLDNCSSTEAHQKLAGLLWPERTLRWGVSLKLFGVNRRFGPAAMRLLQGVERTSSLEQAAEQMGMDPAEGTKLMEDMAREWGFAMVETGADGRARLSEGGAQLLFRYVAMQEKIEKAAAEAFNECFDWEETF